MPDNNFTHIFFQSKIVGKPKLKGGGTANTQTSQNRINRSHHGAYIKSRTSELSRFWKERRTQLNFTDISIGIPFLLQIDPESDVEFLRGLGFEIVCSLDDGFIVVATTDVDLTTLVSKTDDFINKVSSRCDSPAKIFAMCEDEDRLRYILSEDLYENWTRLNDDEIYYASIGISCSGTTPLPSKPIQNENESNINYEKRLNNWRIKFNEVYQQWDDIAYERQENIINIIEPYGGEITSSFIQETDSFSFQLKINGRGLRDFVLNYPYVFEVSKAVDIQMENSMENNNTSNIAVNIEPPEANAPIICVIDSGIQEGHLYISPAIVTEDSVSYIPNNTSVTDEVYGGGHGTRVAGGILYPAGVVQFGTYKLPCFIRNVRVLDSNNGLPIGVDPVKIIVDAVNKFYDNGTLISKIYNQSLCERYSFTSLKHMSPWAAQIDLQSYEKDILFIQAAGNIPEYIIKSLIQAGYPYPNYFGNDLTRLANPAQSLQALTVGSVSLSNFETDDTIAMGRDGEISSFSRVGPGIWDTIKPDVVEYGGTHAINKVGNDILLTTPPDVCPELLRRSPPWFCL